MRIGRPRWLQWLAGAPESPAGIPGGDMGHLLDVRKRVFSELGDVRAVKALFAGTPDRTAYVRYLINVFHYASTAPRS